MTVGAPGPILGPDGLFQVYARDVGQGREPGQDVGELGGGFFLRPVAAEGRGQLANFLHEPHERTGRTAPGVLGPKRIPNQVLQLGQGHNAWAAGAVSCDSSISPRPCQNCDFVGRTFLSAERPRQTGMSAPRGGYSLPNRFFNFSASSFFPWPSSAF